MAADLLEFRPRWAPHVVGRYPARTADPETGEPEEQRVDVTCEACGQQHRATCRQGRPREHVAKFAVLHLHRDPLAAR